MASRSLEELLEYPFPEDDLLNATEIARLCHYTSIQRFEVDDLSIGLEKNYAMAVRAGDLARLQAIFHARADKIKEDSAVYELFSLRLAPYFTPIYMLLSYAINDAVDDGVNPEKLIEIAKWLIDEIKVPVSGTDILGDTAIMEAAPKGFRDSGFSDLLIKAGADINCRNRAGVTIGHTALSAILDSSDLPETIRQSALGYLTEPWEPNKANRPDALKRLRYFLRHRGTVDIPNRVGTTVRDLVGLLAKLSNSPIPPKTAKRVLNRPNLNTFPLRHCPTTSRSAMRAHFKMQYEELRKSTVKDKVVGRRPAQQTTSQETTAVAGPPIEYRVEIANSPETITVPLLAKEPPVQQFKKLDDAATVRTSIEHLVRVPNSRDNTIVSMPAKEAMEQGSRPENGSGVRPSTKSGVQVPNSQDQTASLTQARELLSKLANGQQVRVAIEQSSGDRIQTIHGRESTARPPSAEGLPVPPNNRQENRSSERRQGFVDGLQTLLRQCYSPTCELRASVVPSTVPGLQVMDLALYDVEPIPRNAKCPCQSGRKFKKCHGKSASGQAGEEADGKAD